VARQAIVGAVLAVIFAIAASPAYPCTPDADIILRPAPEEEQAPAEPDALGKPYKAGDTVVASGRGFDPGAVTPVWLRFGGADAPVFAKAPILADGTWEVTFRIPAGLKAGTYVLYAEAFATQPSGVDGARGQMINGLPARELVAIGEVSAASPPPAPSTRSPGEPAPARTARKPEKVKTPRVAGSPTTSRPEPSASPIVTPMPPARVAPAIAQPVAAPVTPVVVDAEPSRTHTVRFAPAPIALRIELPRVAAPARAPELPIAAATQTDAAALSWLVLVVGAFGFLLLGASAGGLVLVGRRPPVDPTDSLEAELQEMIAEERTRQSPAERR